MNDGREPKVSVIVPAYNAETTIRETIDSVLHQTYDDFELLVIDDGSTDGTEEIVAGIGDVRVRCVSFANAGPSAARNRGLGYVSGEFVAFLDADDLWLPEKLASQVDALARNPEAALVFSWHDVIDNDGTFLKAGPHVDPESTAYENLIVWNFVDNGSTPMIRAEAFSQVGNFDETLRYGEDWDMWLRLAYHYRIICIPEVQVLYRVRPGSASSNIGPMVVGTLEVLRRALDRLPPTRERGLLERTSKANLYQSLAMRLVETSKGRRTGLEATRYWWNYVTTTPYLLSQLSRIAFIGSAILAILILPPSQYSRLRRRWSRIRAR